MQPGFYTMPARRDAGLQEDPIIFRFTAECVWRLKPISMFPYITLCFNRILSFGVLVS